MSESLALFDAYDRRAIAMKMRKATAEKKIVALPKGREPYAQSLEIPFNDLRPFSKYQRNQCRHIHSDDPAPNYFSCGNETESGKTYCKHHEAIAYYRAPRHSVGAA